MEEQLQKEQEQTNQEKVSSPNSQTGQNIVINQVQEKQSNGIGTVGFVLSILGVVLCWIPVLDWILWGLGFLFSVIGIFKKPKGLSIAGLVISLFDLILLLVVTAALLSL